MVKTTDNGQTFLQKNLPSPNNKNLLGIYCDVSGQICTSVGTQLLRSPLQGIGYYSLDGGETWMIANMPILAASVQLFAVSGGDD